MAESESALTIVEDNNTQLAPTELLGTSPKARLEEAIDVSRGLAPVIKEQGLFVDIQGKSYVLFEGWTLLGCRSGIHQRASSPQKSTVLVKRGNPLEINHFLGKTLSHTLPRRVGEAATARSV